MNKIFLVAALLGLGPSAQAAYSSVKGGSQFGLEVQPIFGYERVQKLYPTTHQTSRLLFGARATLGVPLLAVEVEYTRGQDSEVIAGQTIDETDDRIKVGARSRFNLGPIFHFTARAGAQMKKTSRTITQGGVSSTASLAPTYSPYAGAAVGARVGSLFVLEGGVTVIFTTFPDLSGNEYQGTLGFNIRIGI